MPPQYLLSSLMDYAMESGVTTQPSGLFLDWWLFLAALGADECQKVLGVKWVTANGLLSGGAQGDVYAAIVGQNQHPQIAQHVLPFFGTQVWIVCHLLLNLVGGQLVLIAKGLQLKVISGDAVFHQEILGAFHAALGKFLIVFDRAPGVRMAAEDQVGIRHVSQVILVIAGEGFQDFCLAVEQATL